MDWRVVTTEALLAELGRRGCDVRRAFGPAAVVVAPAGSFYVDLFRPGVVAVIACDGADMPVMCLGRRELAEPGAVGWLLGVLGCRDGGAAMMTLARLTLVSVDRPGRELPWSGAWLLEGAGREALWLWSVARADGVVEVSGGGRLGPLEPVALPGLSDRFAAGELVRAAVRDGVSEPTVVPVHAGWAGRLLAAGLLGAGSSG